MQVIKNLNKFNCLVFEISSNKKIRLNKIVFEDKINSISYNNNVFRFLREDKDFLNNNLSEKYCLDQIFIKPKKYNCYQDYIDEINKTVYLSIISSLEKESYSYLFDLEEGKYSSENSFFLLQNNFKPKFFIEFKKNFDERKSSFIEIEEDFEYEKLNFSDDFIGKKLFLLNSVTPEVGKILIDPLTNKMIQLKKTITSYKILYHAQFCGDKLNYIDLGFIKIYLDQINFWKDTIENKNVSLKIDDLKPFFKLNNKLQVENFEKETYVFENFTLINSKGKIFELNENEFQSDFSFQFTNLEGKIGVEKGDIIKFESNFFKNITKKTSLLISNGFTSSISFNFTSEFQLNGFKFQIKNLEKIENGTYVIQKENKNGIAEVKFYQNKIKIDKIKTGELMKTSLFYLVLKEKLIENDEFVIPIKPIEFNLENKIDLPFKINENFNENEITLQKINFLTEIQYLNEYLRANKYYSLYSQFKNSLVSKLKINFEEIDLTKLEYNVEHSIENYDDKWYTYLKDRYRKYIWIGTNFTEEYYFSDKIKFEKRLISPKTVYDEEQIVNLKFSFDKNIEKIININLDNIEYNSNITLKKIENKIEIDLKKFETLQTNGGKIYLYLDSQHHYPFENTTEGRLFYEEI